MSIEPSIENHLSINKISLFGLKIKKVLLTGILTGRVSIEFSSRSNGLCPLNISIDRHSPTQGVNRKCPSIEFSSLKKQSKMKRSLLFGFIGNRILHVSI